jgi:hypothetical protein|nr:MAG TPA: hypothetical protein [Caudoviricetes sp.]
MTYRLAVQNDQGEWIDLDLADISPVMNYQVNLLSDLKDRNGDYSQNISLPRTPHNLRAFGFGPLVQSKSGTPYSRHFCELYADGVRITSIGSTLILLSLKKEAIDVQIVGNSIDLSKLLGDKNMESVQKDGFWMMFDIKNIPSGGKGTLSNGVRLAYPYALLSTGKLPSSDTVPVGFMANASRIYPHVNIYDVAQWLLKQEGYSLVSNILDTDKAQLYIPCIAIDKTLGTAYDSKARGLRTIEVYGNTPIKWELNADGRTGVWEVGANAESLSYAPQSPETLTMDIDLSGVANPSSQNGTLRVALRTAAGATYLLANLLIGGGVSNPTEIKKTITQELFPGDTISISGTGSTSPGTTLNLQCYIDFSAVQTARNDLDEIYPTDTIDLLNSLGFKTRLDFIKFFIQLFGCTLFIDSKARTVSLLTFSNLIGNKSKAKDWGDKIVKSSEIEVTYVPDGYAQNNRIALSDNKSNDIEDSVSFTIGDVNLDTEKTLFTLGVMPFGTQSDGGVIYPNYPVFDFSGDSPSYDPPKMSGVIKLLSTSHSHVLSQGDVSKTIYLPDAVPVRIGEIAGEYYKDLFSEILSRYKKVKAYFVLSPGDIQQFDFFTPIYLPQLGFYFYVQKIQNYRAKSITQIELIRM